MIKTTIIIPEYDQEKILRSDVDVALPFRCPIQLLPGTILQFYDHPEKHIIVTELLNVNIIHPVYLVSDIFNYLWGIIYRSVSWWLIQKGKANN
jgi:hypothetical protein